MSMSGNGIPYFPVYSIFFEREEIELLEAKFGIRASYVVMRLLCKIYKEGYYVSWGKEQSIIFLRKIGGEVNQETMEQIVSLLLEKGFFDKKSYEKYSILTSEEIQKVWMEATVRRKRDFSALPYLLNVKPEEGKQKESSTKQNADHSSTQSKLSPENADISGQSKLNNTKLLSEEEDNNETSFEIPAYAHNHATHNVDGLLDSLDRHKVIDTKERQTILQLSDYGRKGTQIWKLFSSTNWSKIGAPGKYIIAVLTAKR